MIRRALMAITARLPGRIITEGDAPYLERYYLGTAFGRRFYLHRFVGSDPDRGVHDHPWRRAWSFILSGWYYEERRDGLRRVRWFNSLHGDTFHRVILPMDVADDLFFDGKPNPPRECWSLFVHTVGDVKGWGFLYNVDSEGRGQPPDGRTFAAYEPFVYPGGKKNPEWWKTAPKGRDLVGRAA